MPGRIVEKYYRELIGQSFECIYSEHVSLQNISRCTKCGTVIFDRDDEDYEPNLKCPTCTDYKTHFTYWTKEQIDNDPDKQKEIEYYQYRSEEQRKDDERYYKRGRLYDFEKTHRKVIFRNKKWTVDIQLVGYSKWDLQAHINVWKRTDDISLSCKHHIKIPISPYTMWAYIRGKIKLVVTWKEV